MGRERGRDEGISTSDRQRHLDGISLERRHWLRPAHGQKGPDPGGGEKSGGRTVVLSLPGALPIEGGLPVVVDGKVIGAIGVNDVTSQQDAQIAKAGVDMLAKALGR